TAILAGGARRDAQDFGGDSAGSGTDRGARPGRVGDSRAAAEGPGAAGRAAVADTRRRARTGFGPGAAAAGTAGHAGTQEPAVRAGDPARSAAGTAPAAAGGGADRDPRGRSAVQPGRGAD